MKSQLLLKVNSTEEAKEILEIAYKNGKNATYCEGGQIVKGSYIFAIWDGKNQVTISSDYYSQSPLDEMFSKFSCS